MQLLERIANEVSKRRRLPMTVTYKTVGGKSKQLEAEYDTLFDSADIGTAIVPIRELKDWLRMTVRAEMETINVKVAEAQPQN